MICPICSEKLIDENFRISCSKDILVITESGGTGTVSHYYFNKSKSYSRVLLYDVDYNADYAHDLYSITIYNKKGNIDKKLYTYNLPIDSKIESTIRKIISNQVFA